MNDVIRTAFEKEDREENFLFSEISLLLSTRKRLLKNKATSFIAFFNFRKSPFSESIESILTYVMRF